MGGGGGWIVDDGLCLSLGHRQQCCEFSNDRNKLNPQDKMGQLLGAVWHQSHPYECHSLAPKTLWYTLVV